VQRERHAALHIVQIARYRTHRHNRREKIMQLVQAPNDPKVWVTDFITRRHVEDMTEMNILVPLVRGILQIPAQILARIPDVTLSGH
jgi:predicted NAD/FAD-binding protein